MERLQKRISTLGYTSRRKAEDLIMEGKVKVNGIVVTEMGYKVKPKDVIEVEGNILDNNKSYEYYILNKPSGIITSNSDELGRKTVIDLIPTDVRIFPVGRLDYDTTGILLLTNDGHLANKLMHPASGINKTYVAKVNGIVTGYDISRLRKGIIIDGIKTNRAMVKLKSTDKKKKTSIVYLTINEGRNHQVKRMFETLGYKVMKLKREKYAFLDLRGLKPGEYRTLSNKEIAILYSMIKSN